MPSKRERCDPVMLLQLHVGIRISAVTAGKRGYGNFGVAMPLVLGPRSKLSALLLKRLFLHGSSTFNSPRFERRSNFVMNA